MMSEPVERWARHGFDPNIKSDHITNNMSECFNSWIKDERDKPVLQLLEHFRRRIMVRFCEKWEEVQKWNDSITPYAREMLATNEKEARKLQVIHGRGEWYETVNKYGKKFLVSVADGTCDCGMWQMSGLSCMHAIAVFMYRREFAQDYVHWYYSKEAMKMTYDGTINPIPDESRWPEYQSEIIEPPVKRAKVGRPKKNRKRAANEPRAPAATFSKRCTICHEIEHNNWTCPSKVNNFSFIQSIKLFSFFFEK